MNRQQLINKVIEKAMMDYLVFMDFTEEEITAFAHEASDEELMDYLEE